MNLDLRECITRIVAVNPKLDRGVLNVEFYNEDRDEYGSRLTIVGANRTGVDWARTSGTERYDWDYGDIRRYEIAIVETGGSHLVGAMSLTLKVRYKREHR